MSKGDRKDETNNPPKYEKKYPDGGWGWVIVVAAGISNFINIPVMQSFALLFKNRMQQLNISTTDLATIINVNAAFGMGLGIITGPLLKKWGYRKVALFGAFSSFIGITATSWATTFVDFLVTYSIITSMGTFLLMSSFSIAINTYFHERRGYASGMSTTLTGLGPVVMPQVITILLYHYDTTGTTMILGGLSLHSVAAALLLHPVKYHMKTILIDPENGQEEVKEELLNEKNDNSATDEKRRRKRTTSNSVDQDNDFDSYSVYGLETPLVVHRKFGSSQQLSRRRKSSTFSYQRSVSQNDVPDDTVSKRLSLINNDTSNSQDTVNLGSSVRIFDEKMYCQLSQANINDEKRKERLLVKKEERDMKSVSINENNNFSSAKNNSQQEISNEENKNIFMKCIKHTVKFFDLDLLRDPVYVILMVGMSLAICAELNFSLFTPLILGDYGFSLQRISTFMSVVAFVDIIFRFLAPFIGGKLKYSAQTMYLISLVMLITARTSLMIFHDYTSAIVVACGLGVAKGFRTVYMVVVIPDYVPLERLASASGIQSVVNCFCIVLSIPLMAAVRDKTGSFNWCIAALNCITFATIFMWTIQIVYNRCKKSSKNEVYE